MSAKVRSENARYQAVEGYPHLELDSKSGIYYVRASVRGRGEIFKSTRQKKVRAADTVAKEILREVEDRKAGLRNERIRIRDLCELALAELKEQTETLDEEGHPLRRRSTYENNDKAHLRGPLPRNQKRRKGMREQGVIRELFGDTYADEWDERAWDEWVKKKGRKLGRKLNDIAKYLSLVLTYAFMEKYIARKPEIKGPDKHKKKAVSYSDAQTLLFFQKAEPTLQDLIVIGSENPIRPHENAEVRWSMVKIVEEAGKPPIVEYELPEWFVKKNARTLRLTPNAAAVVLRRRAEMLKLPPDRRSIYVFPAPKDTKKPLSRKTINRMWHRMKDAVGLDKSVKIQFHWFRHNVFNRLRKFHGIDSASASQVGGTSVLTLEKHYDLEEEQAKVRVAGAIHFPFFSKQPDTSEEE